MIPIYICEDDKQMLEFETKVISDYCTFNDCGFQIELSTSNPETLLRHMSDSKRFGIYFLDVDLNHEMNGFDLGRKIREIDIQGFIIFVTTHDELLSETFKYRLEAMDYIVKDSPDKMRDKIENALGYISNHLQQDSILDKPFFSVKSFGSLRHIPLDSILYFETGHRKHVVTLHLESETLDFHSSLQEVIDQIDDSFTRVHRSFVVNMNEVVEYNNKESVLIMSNGEKCYVSKRMKKDIVSLLEG